MTQVTGQPTPIEDRFWDKVLIPLENFDDCWEWQGALRNGYGVIGRGRRTERIEYAHRWVFQKFHGPLVPGMDICHNCNNRACVNFTHLYQGTRKENMEQAQRQGRLKRAYRPWSLNRRNPKRKSNG